MCPTGLVKSDDLIWSILQTFLQIFYRFVKELLFDNEMTLRFETINEM